MDKPSKPARKSSKPAPSAVEDGTVQLNLRAPRDVADKLTAWVDSLNSRAASRGVRWNRNAVILAAVERALSERAPDGEP